MAVYRTKFVQTAYGLELASSGSARTPMLEAILTYEADSAAEAAEVARGTFRMLVGDSEAMKIVGPEIVVDSG